MIETQVAQLASSCPNANTGKLPGQPEVPSKENVNAVTMRGGKSTREPPFPQDAGGCRLQHICNSGRPHGTPRTSWDYHDTTTLPFPERIRKPVADEQFSKFVEVIKKLYVNIPLLDAMQVPMYAKYIKYMLGNKRALATTEVVQLTE